MDHATYVTGRKSFEENPCLFQYSRDYDHMGKCLIINNEKFDVMDQRHGTKVDGALLGKTFAALKFTVQVENNLSVDDMLGVLQKVSEEDHRERACFVCVLLSHGENGTIYGTDKQVPLRRLTSLLTAKRCPSLEGKPKLFFIQACRGKEFDAGVEADSAEEDEESVDMSEIPETDFLCSYSTVPGYFAWRNRVTGSIYIRNLCEMLKQNRGLEITKILTRVNHRVALDFESKTNEAHSAISQVTMPVERMRMRPWLEEQINSDKIPGLKWVNREKRIFQIPWMHAARHGWDVEKDAPLFRNWAIHTGKHQPGVDRPDPKTWKANFRCAMNSLPDIEEVKDKSIKKGTNAFRVYKMLLPSERPTKKGKKRGEKEEKIKVERKSPSRRSGMKVVKVESSVDSTVLTDTHRLATRHSIVDHLIISDLPDVCQTIEVMTENEDRSVSSSHAYPLQISPISSYDSDTDSVRSEEETKEGLRGLWNLCQAEGTNSVLKLPGMATFVTSGKTNFKHFRSRPRPRNSRQRHHEDLRHLQVYRQNLLIQDYKDYCSGTGPVGGWSGTAGGRTARVWFWWNAPARAWVCGEVPPSEDDSGTGDPIHHCCPLVDGRH
ncbi:hypothetical protein SKAU_G00038760 [Synaphobranchus kaupii]|uniref:Uncharacterized protein n=1 Tax=Synaphobranchus kaupii TaxID=118154 RepID=A0A9Q1JF34_SYNKA|nr:hypothetical protein SKAU_G00038760 [Synaphobranchus kaupii]